MQERADGGRTPSRRGGSKVTERAPAEAALSAGAALVTSAMIARADEPLAQPPESRPTRSMGHVRQPSSIQARVPSVCRR